MCMFWDILLFRQQKKNETVIYQLPRAVRIKDTWYILYMQTGTFNFEFSFGVELLIKEKNIFYATSMHKNGTKINRKGTGKKSRLSKNKLGHLGWLWLPSNWDFSLFPFRIIQSLRVLLNCLFLL